MGIQTGLSRKRQPRFFYFFLAPQAWLQAAQLPQGALSPWHCMAAARSRARVCLPLPSGPQMAQQWGSFPAAQAASSRSRRA